jgi:hypothetical protein
LAISSGRHAPHARSVIQTGATPVNIAPPLDDYLKWDRVSTAITHVIAVTAVLVTAKVAV